MSDERERILKLLEDGKINAEQAARLIEALGSSRPEFGPMSGPRMGRHRMGMRGMDRIPDLVAHAVTSAMKAGFEPGGDGRSEFPGKHELQLKNVSGDVEIEGQGEDRIDLKYSGGLVKVREDGDAVMVRSVSGDVEARVPGNTRLEIEAVSGDVTIAGVNGKAWVKTVSGDVMIADSEGDKTVATVSGDIDLARVTGELDIMTRSGDVDLIAVGPLSGQVSTKSGDVRLAFGTNADVVLELVCEEDGDIEIDPDLPHEVVEQREGYAKVKLGAGSRTLRIKTGHADIAVRLA
jgi:DUF4097 and DUF4098 domain-containing protein YvlB